MNGMFRVLATHHENKCGLASIPYVRITRRTGPFASLANGDHLNVGGLPMIEKVTATAQKRERAWYGILVGMALVTVLALALTSGRATDQTSLLAEEAFAEEPFPVESTSLISTQVTPLSRVEEPLPEKCGVCNGPVVSIASVTDDRTKPSRNIKVWNRSICANLTYSGDSLICTRCWHAYSPYMPGTWQRALERPEGFQQALSFAIAQFPLPSNDNVHSLVVYYQSWDGSVCDEEVMFWATDDDQYLSRAEKFAEANGLVLAIERDRGAKEQVIVSAKAKPHTKPANDE